ncbi:MAG: PQQ-dependent sugar dehydrogenase [Chitinophagaceae bacterium]|nr:PQQ-dependent sugar dehydrogenase [Chitinophagaceae bacterium]
MKQTLLSVCIFLISLTLKAQTLSLDSTTLSISVALDSSKLTAPWDIEWGFDNRLWMTDAAKVKVWNPATGTLKTLFTFPKGYGLGIALPRAMASSGPTYVYAVFDTIYYYQSGNYCRVYRFEYDKVADTLRNPTLLFGYKHIGEHAGGRIILAQDGKLWLNTADYTFASDTLGGTVGRVIRMNTDGTIPAGNLAADYTYSKGHRNPQGLIQLPDGKIFASEHSGPNIHDEINRITLGGHYGWPALQGYSNCTGSVSDSCSSARFTTAHNAPVYAGPMTPAGIDYYHHPAIPEWQNCLLVSTLYSPDSCLAVLQFNAAHDAILNRRNYLKKNVGGINDFKRTRDIAVASDGSIYCIVHDRSYSLSGGTITNKGTKIVRLKNEAYKPVSVAEQALVQNLHIYPNPARNEFSIELKNFTGTPQPYILLNQAGVIVLSGLLEAAQTQLSVAALPAGLYELRVQQQTEKIMVIH